MDDSMTNQRDSFEKWAEESGYTLTLETRHNLSTATYRLSHTQSAYEGYQAAQAALIAEIVGKLEREKCHDDCVAGVVNDSAINRAIEIVKGAGQ